MFLFLDIGNETRSRELDQVNRTSFPRTIMELDLEILVLCFALPTIAAMFSEDFFHVGLQEIVKALRFPLFPGKLKARVLIGEYNHSTEVFKLLLCGPRFFCPFGLSRRFGGFGCFLTGAWGRIVFNDSIIRV